MIAMGHDYPLPWDKETRKKPKFNAKQRVSLAAQVTDIMNRKKKTA
ncbi:hypothetical protein [Sunxiuqinia indica]|nr:hypothetical protein [Sunxiuqinia indica]